MPRGIAKRGQRRKNLTKTSLAGHNNIQGALHQMNVGLQQQSAAWAILNNMFGTTGGSNATRTYKRKGTLAGNAINT